MASIPSQTITGRKRIFDHNGYLSNVAWKWVSVLVQASWRFVDIKSTTERLLNMPQAHSNQKWELIDRGKKTIKHNNEKTVHMSENEHFPSKQRGNTADPDTAFYFLTDPEEFIFTHFPDEESWQLLARPVSKQEAQHMPCLSPDFFRYGLILHAPSKCAIQCDTGEVTIELGFQGRRRRFDHWRLQENQDHQVRSARQSPECLRCHGLSSV